MRGVCVSPAGRIQEARLMISRKQQHLTRLCATLSPSDAERALFARGFLAGEGLKWTDVAAKGAWTDLETTLPAAKRAGTNLKMALLAAKGIDPGLKWTEMELNRGGLDLNCSATQLKGDETGSPDGETELKGNPPSTPKGAKGKRGHRLRRLGVRSGWQTSRLIGLWCVSRISRATLTPTLSPRRGGILNPISRGIFSR